MNEAFTFVDDQLLRAGTLEFHCDLQVRKAPDGRIPVMKERRMVEHYIQLARDLPARTIVELGIRLGGSTVLVNELFQPDALVALELDVEPAAALSRYIDLRDLADRVRPHYGVDQSDRPRLAQILHDDLGDRPVDLVIDDASHLYDETVASFEVLYPRLREGGVYLIEDWNTDHLLGDAIRATLGDAAAPDHAVVRAQVDALRPGGDGLPVGRTPLLLLAIELMLIRASPGDVVREVEVNESWVVVRRGADALDPSGFRLRDHVHDHFGYTERGRPR